MYTIRLEVSGVREFRDGTSHWMTLYEGGFAKRYLTKRGATKARNKRQAEVPARNQHSVVYYVRKIEKVKK